MDSYFSDLHYYPANYLRSMFWIGLSGSFVRLDPTLKKWVLIQTATSTTAISDATEASLLMGVSHAKYIHAINVQKYKCSF
jgi:hypothetical protein